MGTSLFKGPLQKKWFLAILLVLLAIETIILVVIMVEWSLGNQNFPPLSINPAVRVNCATLISNVVSQNSNNRTVVYWCNGPRAAAVEGWSPFSIPATRENPSGVAVPIFTLPRGYLNLSITPESLFDCSYQYRSPLRSGQVVGLAGGYVYCGIISNSAGAVAGFNIKWLPAPPSSPAPPPPSIRISASPTNFTLTAGQSVTTTVTVTSVNRFNGTVSLGYDIANLIPGGYSGSGGPTVAFDHSKVLVTALSGSNSTAAIVMTATTAPKGLYIIDIWAQIPNSIFSVNLYVTVT